MAQRRSQKELIEHHKAQAAYWDSRSKEFAAKAAEAREAAGVE